MTGKEQLHEIAAPAALARNDDIKQTASLRRRPESRETEKDTGRIRYRLNRKDATLGPNDR